MSYKNVHKNLTPAGRKKGREVAHQVKAEKRNARIAKVKLLRAQRVSKSEIARRLGVSDETVRRDCKTFEEKTTRPIATSIIDAVFTIVHNEIAGNITSDEARQQVKELIELTVQKGDEDD